LDEIQAALLLARLNWLEEFTQRRRQVAKMYHEGFNNPAIQLLSQPAQEKSHVYHLFVVLCKERERLAKYLTERGIQTFVHYPVPIHFQIPTKELHRDPNGLRFAEQHATQCLSIPCHPQMSDNNVAMVIDSINAFK
jgi:dTDP-4-amino-4,6-dideoxygalactose transaminase